jgi:hypothetical protein
MIEVHPFPRRLAENSIMAAVVIHFGVGDLHRVSVLEKAGYVVSDCQSAMGLYSSLLQFPDPDAVAISESDLIDGDEMISLIRSHSTAPLILFQGPAPLIETSEFDLVVPPLTEPRIWLGDLAGLVEHNRAIRDHSRLIRK